MCCSQCWPCGNRSFLIALLPALWCAFKSIISVYLQIKPKKPLVTSLEDTTTTLLSRKVMGSAIAPAYIICIFLYISVGFCTRSHHTRTFATWESLQRTSYKDTTDIITSPTSHLPAKRSLRLPPLSASSPGRTWSVVPAFSPASGSAITYNF